MTTKPKPMIAGISLRRPGAPPPSEEQIAALEKRVEIRQRMPAGTPEAVPEAPPVRGTLAKLAASLDRTLSDHGVAPSSTSALNPDGPSERFARASSSGTSSAPKPSRLSVQSPSGPSTPEPSGSRLRIVDRKGRMRGDGTRTEASPRARLTIYLEPELARAIDRVAFEAGRDRSTVIEEALREHLARRGLR